MNKIVEALRGALLVMRGEALPLKRHAIQQVEDALAEHDAQPAAEPAAWISPTNLRDLIWARAHPTRIIASANCWQVATASATIPLYAHPAQPAAEPQQERDPPMLETLADAYDAVQQERTERAGMSVLIGDAEVALPAIPKTITSRAQRDRFMFASGWQAALAQRKPLSDEQIDAIQGAAYRALADAGYTGGMGSTTWDRASARAIEAAHGIK
jgi:hypothetical protein